MEIKTKYDIGDKVFAIFKSIDSGKYFCFEGMLVIKKIVIDKELDIVYCAKRLSNGFFDFNILEKFCFATKEQAQDKCDELNDKNKFAKELEKAVERKVAEPLDKKL